MYSCIAIVIHFTKFLKLKNLGLNRRYHHGLHSLRDHLDSLTTKTHAVDWNQDNFLTSRFDFDSKSNLNVRKKSLTNHKHCLWDISSEVIILKSPFSVKICRPSKIYDYQNCLISLVIYCLSLLISWNFSGFTYHCVYGLWQVIVVNR